MARGAIRQALNLPIGENLKTSRTYRIWYAMRGRCLYPRHHAFYRYGGRGISIDPRWSNFLLFLEDMGHPPSELHTIDRINNDGNYCKGNCKWSTKQEQNKNKSNLYQIKTGNETMSLADACLKAGLPYQSVYKRIRTYGWAIDKALSTPIRGYKNA